MKNSDIASLISNYSNKRKENTKSLSFVLSLKCRSNGLKQNAFKTHLSLRSSFGIFFMGRNQFIAHKAAGLIEFAYFPVLSISREWIRTNSTVYKKAAGAIFEKKSSQTICRMFGLSKCHLVRSDPLPLLKCLRNEIFENNFKRHTDGPFFRQKTNFVSWKQKCSVLFSSGNSSSQQKILRQISPDENYIIIIVNLYHKWF